MAFTQVTKPNIKKSIPMKAIEITMSLLLSEFTLTEAFNFLRLVFEDEIHFI